jgi:hypothetical protein
MIRQKRVHRIALPLVVFALAACAGGFVNIRPRVGGPAESGIGTTGRDDPQPSLGGAIGTPGKAHRPLTATERRVCKSSSWPRGWVATMYQRSGSECPAGRGADSVGMMAVITRHDQLPRNSVLDICADQMIPAGWELLSREPEDLADLCPGAAKQGSSSVKRIRRAH